VQKIKNKITETVYKKASTDEFVILSYDV